MFVFVFDFAVICCQGGGFFVWILDFCWFDAWLVVCYLVVVPVYFVFGFKFWCFVFGLL